MYRNTETTFPPCTQVSDSIMSTHLSASNNELSTGQGSDFFCLLDTQWVVHGFTETETQSDPAVCPEVRSRSYCRKTCLLGPTLKTFQSVKNTSKTQETKTCDQWKRSLQHHRNRQKPEHCDQEFGVLGI